MGDSMPQKGMMNRIVRKDFSKVPPIIEMPYLIEVQRNSYFNFLQAETPYESRELKGLEEVFSTVFPIEDYKGIVSLEYVGYEIGIWECGCGDFKGLGSRGVKCSICGQAAVYQEKFSEEECRQKGLTYAAPLKVLVQLIIKDKDESGDSSVREIKEQKIYLGEIPLMSKTGTFIFNGTERVVVSQMHRSPGVFFLPDKAKSQVSGKTMYTARVIPYRGSWIDFEFDAKDILWVRIDRRRKFHGTVLLKALGYTPEELLRKFYEFAKATYSPSDGLFQVEASDFVLGRKVEGNIVNPENGEVIVKAGRKITMAALKKLKNAKIESITFNDADMLGNVLAGDIVDLETGEVLMEYNTKLDEASLDSLKGSGVTEFELLKVKERSGEKGLRDTLEVDKIETKGEALREIYKRIRPGEPPTEKTAEALFDMLFFNAKRYDLSEVGRMKINQKLGVDQSLTHRLLTPEDVLQTVKYLYDLRKGIGEIDDIDNLGNRRIRAIGESLENQFRLGLVRMEKAIMDRMNMQDIDTAMPHDLINSKPVTAAIKEFFGSSQLSQFMDQTNPLSEITHKRRLSALGPGGLTRERASFEVRDVHPTHYGRICPIETPEGPNIGLIASLASYVKVNQFGFIESPYRKVTNGKVTDEVVYLSANQERGFAMTQATSELDSDGNFLSELITARKSGEFLTLPPSEIDYMDVSPKQLVSVAAALIPFLEHDDANRALMGSNMQRQGVPLMRSDAPYVGTGMERIVARDSGASVVAERAGTVVKSDGNRIVIREEVEGKFKIRVYPLIKYRRSNQNTCINQKPVVVPGQKVEKGDVLADGPATERGDLALGRNVNVAFMPWDGYNFEDAIIVSEKLIKEDIFTSIHIEEFDVDSRDTKQGKEEITRDIPNVGEEALMNLDESGIVRIGAKIKTGDILVGKVTPKAETLLSPEEKLLKAIFGEKAGEWRDSSLRAPSGVDGTVINVKVFSRKGVDKDARSIEIEKQELAAAIAECEGQIDLARKECADYQRSILEGCIAATEVQLGDEKVSKQGVISADLLSGATFAQVNSVIVTDSAVMEKVTEARDEVTAEEFQVKSHLENRKLKLKKGDELAPGVIKTVKVFVAMKRRLSVGDKMAGRHGNKGVVSIIVPEEDMPFNENGETIDIILNPLGVPSRMNVGQILETNLGLAAKKLGVHFATPVFDGASEADVVEYLKKAGCEENGKMTLWNGKTGHSFDQKIVVGQIYMMKLHHLVDDKIHARSTGPYSLVTQQPLGGKAQFGGQRLGEMEVWALEAYGAAHALQEMLTVKSDDVEGRKRMYEAIVKGDNSLKPGVPESFNVLVKELQSLCLDVELINEEVAVGEDGEEE